MKREEPCKHIQTSITRGAKERLVKNRKSAPITVFFQTVCYIYLIKRSLLYFNFCLPCLVFPQAICYTTVVSFEEATLTALCCCTCSVWVFCYIAKRQNTHLKYFFSVLRTFLWSTAGFFILYTPPVSGNILAPLHGFNGRDREYALKVNTTSVRN